MATSQKKTGGSRSASSSSGGRRTASSSSKSKSGSSRSRKQPPAPAHRPFRREVGAGICLLLAIFTIFGCFHIQALFIDALCGLIKGLIGYGFWLMPPALLLASFILAFHRGRPVRLRVFCALMLPLMFSCVVHSVIAESLPWGLRPCGRAERPCPAAACSPACWDRPLSRCSAGWGRRWSLCWLC